MFTVALPLLYSHSIAVLLSAYIYILESVQACCISSQLPIINTNSLINSPIKGLIAYMASKDQIYCLEIMIVKPWRPFFGDRVQPGAAVKEQHKPLCWKLDLFPQGWADVKLLSRSGPVLDKLLDRRGFPIVDMPVYFAPLPFLSGSSRGMPFRHPVIKNHNSVIRAHHRNSSVFALFP